MAYNIQGSDLSLMTQSIANPGIQTLWDYLPKIKSDTSSFVYSKRDTSIRRLPDTKGAGGAEPSLKTSRITALSGMTKEWTAGSEIRSSQKSSLGSRLSAEQEYLATEIKKDILLDCDTELYTGYGTITTSGSYGHSGGDWKPDATSMNQIVSDVITVKAAMFANIGVDPNVLMINKSGLDALSASLIESGNYLNGDFTGTIVNGKVTDLTKIMGLKLWVVDAAVYTSSWASLWGNYAWFMYVDEQPSMLAGKPTFGFVVESGANGTADPWFTKEVSETEKGSNWYLETKYQSAFVESNLKALYRLDSSGSAALY